MKSLTYIISKIDKAVAFEWIATHLNKENYRLSFILLNNQDTYIEQFLKASEIEFYRINFSSKKDYPKAILATRKMLRTLKTDIVHCHMRDANFIGLTAAKSLGIKKRIYTRHFSTFNHEYFPHAVKFDKIINSLSTDIVAISKNVQQVLLKKENANHNKISLIHHGFDLRNFNNPNNEQVVKLQKKYNPAARRPVIGVIARYINWKGHKFIIEAFKTILSDYPNALFIFANANGPEKENIQKLIKENIPNNSLEIKFEKDLFSLYQLFDIYIHTPINSHIEAFGQTYVEALAAGVPSIFTLSGVGNEFIKNNHNALVVPYKNSEKITEKIRLILDDDQLRIKIIHNGKQSVDQFNLPIFINKLESLYA